MDWQAQKERLLASLSAENEEVATPERQQELTTIEEAIAKTDRVVAGKELEIRRLKTELQAEAKRKSDDPVDTPTKQQEQFCADLFDQDEAIQQERTRLEKLQAEWKEKVGKAELEISVERAKMAREKSSLVEKQAALEEIANNASPSPEEKPRRRWLAALGIKEDES